tara:strand:+ start:511 stop:666 length:156 start_codon:yes stop_codon:yes gene_type:complete
MTKKDYILIAQTIKGYKHEKYILKLANELSKQFKKQNQRFNAEKFLEIIAD